jgi:hypothetical protein
MAPAYRTGDTLFLRHMHEGERVTFGEDYILAETGRDSRSPKALPCILLTVTGRTASYWLGVKLNPRKVRRLAQSKWQPAYIVVGCYRTRNPIIAGTELLSAQTGNG